MRALAHGEPPEIDWDELPVVEGGPAQLVAPFQNLIGNAVKFVAPGVKPEVHVGAEPDGELWRFTVADNGIGIEPRQMSSRGRG